MWEHTRGVQVKSGIYIDSHLERCVLIQKAELYTSGKYQNWNFKNISYRPTLAMEDFSIHLWERSRGVQVNSGMYIDSHTERCVLV